MNYEILRKLPLEKFMHKNTFRRIFPEMEGELREVDDNYAINEDEYGLCVGDDSNAINHAYFNIQNISEDELEEEKKEKILDSLAEDYMNYLLCISYMSIQPGKTLEHIMEVLLYYNNNIGACHQCGQNSVNLR